MRVDRQLVFAGILMMGCAQGGVDAPNEASLSEVENTVMVDASIGDSRGVPKGTGADAVAGSPLPQQSTGAGDSVQTGVEENGKESDSTTEDTGIPEDGTSNELDGVPDDRPPGVDGEQVSGAGPDAGSGIDWTAIQDMIDSKVALQNATVMVGNGDGTLFSHSRGDSSEDAAYLIASASKLVTAITLLRIVDSGDLSLDTKPADLLPFWTQDATDPRYGVNLQHLLSFTSGFSGSSGLTGESAALSCVEDGGATTAECTEDIYGQMFSFPPAGSTFYYGPSHLYVAGLMGMTVRDALTWNKVFREEVGDGLELAATSGFLLPSPQNGRPGGGAVMSAKDYATILRALVAGELLTPESTEALTQDWTPSATVTLEYVPDTATEHGTWHYALGCWRECEGDDYDAAFCDTPGVISSPGAFGFYPWWDQVTGYWGVIAVQLNIPGAPKITTAIGAEIRTLMKAAALPE